MHPGIISQYDNLALMNMSSPVDLDGLATYFGFAPPALLARSPGFRQGEALFAGGFVAAPTLLRVGEQLTPEGGSDVTVPLRSLLARKPAFREQSRRPLAPRRPGRVEWVVA